MTDYRITIPDTLLDSETPEEKRLINILNVMGSWAEAFEDGRPLEWIYEAFAQCYPEYNYTKREIEAAIRMALYYRKRAMKLILDKAKIEIVVPELEQ